MNDLESLSEQELNNDRIIKTYVWHGGKCFFISTIERRSSSPYNPCRYNETIVWAYDWDKKERGELLHMDEAAKGSIRTHQRVCEAYFKHGSFVAARSQSVGAKMLEGEK
jgi:hypothetical protein